MGNAVLPEPGDLVEVMFGSDRVRAKVLESYSSGAQPRVVVELLDQTNVEERVTITVPPDSLEPTDATRSPWAAAQRYEGQVFEAVKRVCPGVSIIRQSPYAKIAADFIISAGDHKAFVEAKNYHKPPPQALLKELGKLASESRSTFLLVTSAVVGKSSSVTDDVRVVSWGGEADDVRLKNAISEILALGSER